MAEPTDPAELARVQAQDLYNAAAIGIEDLLDDFPNPTWNSTKMDTWLIDTVSHLTACEQNWSQAGVTSKAWYKLEYSLITRVPDLPMDLVVFSCSEFNELVGQVLDYDLDIVPLPVWHATSKCSKTMVLPFHSCQDAAATHSWLTTLVPFPAPSKTTTPVPATPKRAPPATPKPLTSNSGASNEQVAQPSINNATRAQPLTILKTVKPMPITAGSSDVVFPPDPTSPLHQKLGRNFKVGPPIHAARLTPSVQSSSSRLLTVDGTFSCASFTNAVVTLNFSAATCASVAPGFNPIQEGSIALLFGMHQPLFLPGTDDEEEHVQEDSVREERVEDVAGTNGEDNNTGGPDDEKDSPPLTKKARRLCQEPRILPVAPSFQSQDLRCSARSNTSPVNRDAAYLKMAYRSKPDTKKKKKQDLKRKDIALEVAIPRKCAWEDDKGAPAIEKPAIKKLKSKDIKTADDKVVRATPAIRKRGPGLSKPPAVTLGIGGGEFGEKVPSTMKAIKNGLKSIGVFEVEEDFGNFVKVDGRYWNKEVAPFVGEQYTEPCDHCRRLGMQCRKFLTNTVICVCCHYSKLPCKVNGIPALNPINHYRPKSYHGALDTLAQHANSIEDIVVNYMAGLNALVQLNSLRAQAGCLHECATFDENDTNEDDNNEAPEDVTEGVAGPSKKKKGKLG
ncbi:hypothetical protein EDD85DRAFT_962779 [Armillaria nabsnona]|nr:hypothetical protein EDD85DRAFT_962779 [Armillaria nabsnona]